MFYHVCTNVYMLQNHNASFPNPFTNVSETRHVFVLMAWPFLFTKGHQGVTENTNTGSDRYTPEKVLLHLKSNM